MTKPKNPPPTNGQTNPAANPQNIINALIRQRNDALNQVALLAAELADLQATKHTHDTDEAVSAE